VRLRFAKSQVIVSVHNEDEKTALYSGTISCPSTRTLNSSKTMASLTTEMGDKFAARSAVGGTRDLLDLILPHLDMRTLLISQRVSRLWRVAIQSPTIQKALFFHGDKGRTDRIINPLLLELFPLWFRAPPASHPSTWADHCNQPQALRHLPLADPALNKAFTCREASWRRMLVQQPPLVRLGAVQGPTVWFMGMRELPNGLRMADFYDLAWKASAANDPFSWRVVWMPPLDGEAAEEDEAHWWMRTQAQQRNIEVGAAFETFEYDRWAAKLWKLEDRRLGQLSSADFEVWRCVEYDAFEFNMTCEFVDR
jgi:hypothetical protein